MSPLGSGRGGAAFIVDEFLLLKTVSNGLKSFSLFLKSFSWYILQLDDVNLKFTAMLFPGY
jgi:hypothetical protein